jgi:hypothetical protein
MRHTGRTFAGDFQHRYGVYARDHSMTEERMLAHDKRCYPEALLTPYLLWVSRKWFEWGSCIPERSSMVLTKRACSRNGLRPSSPAVTRSPANVT